MTSLIAEADECAVLKASFEKEESAYDTVVSIAVASNKAYAIIGKFTEEGESLLQRCPDVYSLDRQYTLKRKLSSAKRIRQSYRVLTQPEVGHYARSHPEEIIIYKWGTIRPIP